VSEQRIYPAPGWRYVSPDLLLGSSVACVYDVAAFVDTSGAESTAILVPHAETLGGSLLPLNRGVLVPPGESVQKAAAHAPGLFGEVKRFIDWPLGRAVAR
jgi:hypothetical protein